VQNDSWFHATFQGAFDLPTIVSIDFYGTLPLAPAHTTAGASKVESPLPIVRLRHRRTAP